MLRLTASANRRLLRRYRTSVGERPVSPGAGGFGRSSERIRRLAAEAKLSGSGQAGADYVIVGGGSAGCVLAARLSEDPSIRVQLLEAGGRDRSPNIKIPAAFGKQFHDAKLDWDFETDPEPGCANRRLYIPRGKSLGGSSSMNAMLYVRGRPLDYDLWSGPAPRAGAGTTSCRTFCAPRTTSAAPRSSMRSAVRSTSPTSAPRDR
jgi:hypothetical protein